ncbi:hypothetical protein [Ensifer sp. SSB1]|nr:hypothetical protein [Ensifer sp. SSB1]
MSQCPFCDIHPPTEIKDTDIVNSQHVGVDIHNKQNETIGEIHR